MVHTAAQGMVRFSLSRAIKWRCRWWYFSTRPRLEETASRFLRTCNSMLHIKGVRATLLPSVPHAAPSYEPHLSLQLYTYRTRVIPKMPRCSITSLQQGFQKFLPGLLSLFLNTGRASVLSRKRKIWAFLPWQVALPGLGGLPVPSHCQVYCPAAEQESGLPQLPAEQIIPSLREISLDDARQPVHRAAWKNPDS